MACSCRRSTSALAVLGFVTSACSEGPTDESASAVPLALLDAWSLDRAAEDPLEAHRAQTSPCSTEALSVEAIGFEISTESCNYASVTQPALRELRAADRLRFSVWWATLAALEPSEAHLALLVDRQVLWEAQVTIPGPADVKVVEVPVPSDRAAGSSVTFHLHNHGSNSWKIGNIMLVSNEGSQKQ